MSITAISFYWRNDTPNFVTWQSRQATVPDTPMCIVIHSGQFTGGVHPLNQFVPEILSPLLTLPALVHYTLLIVYFFNELISFIESLDKCHTSIFKALICYRVENSLEMGDNAFYQHFLFIKYFKFLENKSKISSHI